MRLYSRALLLALPVGLIAACDAEILMRPLLEGWIAGTAIYGIWILFLIGVVILGTILASYFAYRAPDLDRMYRRSGYLLIAAGISWPTLTLVTIALYGFSLLALLALLEPVLLGLGSVLGGLYLVYFRGEQQNNLRHQLFRYTAAILLSIPVAFLFAMDIALGLGGKDLPYNDQIIWGSMFVAWAGMAYLSLKAPTLGGIFRRNARGFSIAAFLLPVAALILWVTNESTSDPIFPPVMIFAFMMILGCTLGLISWFLSRLRIDDRGITVGRATDSPPSTAETDPGSGA